MTSHRAGRAAAALTLAMLLSWRPDAQAQLADIQMYRDITTGVSATDEGMPTVADGTTLPPSFTPVISGGSIPVGDAVSAGGAYAEAQGEIQYLGSSANLTATADFHAEALGSDPAESLAHVDVVFAFRFGAVAITPFTVRGAIQTSLPLQDLSEFLQCQLNGTVLAGYPASAIPLNTPVSFTRESTIHPGETFQLECRATAGVSNGFGPETIDLHFDFELNLGSATTTTTLPQTRKQCRKACKQAGKACRTACTGTAPERRACKKSCKQRRKQCSLATGCTLPL